MTPVSVFPQGKGVEVRLLGPLEVTVGGCPLRIPTVKLRALVTLLVLDRGRVISSDRLMDGLWDGVPPRTASGTLHAYVSRLRALLAASNEPAARELLISRRSGYQFALTPQQVDTQHFTALLASAQEAGEAGDHRAALAALEPALGLWRGAALADLSDHAFARAEAAALEELRLVAMERQIESRLCLGGHQGVIGELQRLTSRYPLRERLWGQLMLALFRSGRQGEALLVYQRARSHLAEELGIDPTPELRQLATSILKQEHRLHLAPPHSTPASTGATPLALPSSVGASPVEGPFVGREVELDHLCDLWRRARGGEARLVLVTGEPGIGKTRLVTEFASIARQAGGTILWGRCLAETSVPYRPLVEALRDYVARLPGNELPLDAGPGADRLAGLVPGVDPGRAAAGQGMQQRRLRMFEAVAHLLRDAAARRPLLLVLEDLQWADRSTLSLLDHVTRRASDARLLIVATARHLESAPARIRELWDQEAEHLVLGGLTTAQVVELAGRLAPGLADQDGLRALRQRTGGNPFFVGAFLEAAAASPAGTHRTVLAGLPGRARQAIDRWLDTLTPACRRSLEAAATAGREFSVEVLAVVLECPPEQLIELLDMAARRSLVRRLPGFAEMRRGKVMEDNQPDGSVALGFGRCYTFVHDLIAEALYAGTAGPRRSELHRRVGAALRAVQDTRPSFAELAHHYRRAAAEDADLAVEYSVRAGDAALADCGFAEACQHYRAALELLPLTQPGVQEAGCRVLLSLGRASLADYDNAGSLAAYKRAAELALRAGARTELAEAVLGLMWNIEFRFFDRELVGILERSLALVGSSDPDLQAKLLAGLARALPLGSVEADRSAARAVALARQTGDPRTLAFVLSATLQATWRPEEARERLGVATELVHLASELNWPELKIEALNWRATALDELGNVAAADADLERFCEVAVASHRPFYDALAALRQTGRALFTGRYAEAAELVGRTLSNAATRDNFEAGVAAQLFVLQRDRGGLSEVRERVEAFAGAAPDVAAWRAGLALVDVEAGDLRSARHAFDGLARGDFAGIRRDWLWLASMALLAEVCAGLGDRRRAACLHALLLPYASGHVVLAHGVASLGASARYLGLLELALGRLDEAIGHFEASLVQHRRWGATPWTARSASDAAAALARRERPGDGPRAVLLLDEARALASEIGMTGLRAR